jgi:hypothetical protein
MKIPVSSLCILKSAAFWQSLKKRMIHFEKERYLCLACSIFKSFWSEKNIRTWLVRQSNAFLKEKNKLKFKNTLSHLDGISRAMFKDDHDYIQKNQNELREIRMQFLDWMIEKYI